MNPPLDLFESAGILASKVRNKLVCDSVARGTPCLTSAHTTRWGINSGPGTERDGGLDPTGFRSDQARGEVNPLGR